MNKKSIPKSASTKCKDKPYELDKLFPRVVPSNPKKSMPDKKTEESDANRKDIENLTTMFEQLSLRPCDEVCCAKKSDVSQENHSEASCSTKQEPYRSTKPEPHRSTKQEPYHVVGYIKGFHFVVYLKDNPSTLELVPAGKFSRQYTEFLPKSLEDVPNVYPDLTFYWLAAELKKLKLPSPSWKILISLKDHKMMEIKFSLLVDSAERSVTFTADNDNYEVIIDGRPTALVSSPEKLKNKDELDTLLRVVEFM